MTTATLKSGYNEAGTGQGTGKTARDPKLENVLRAAAEDIAGLRGPVIASADAIDLATALTLVNELKAALNARNNTPAAAVLTGGAGPYNLSGAGALVLTVEIDGINRVFSFLTGDFANVAAATAAECAGALNQRGFSAYGVVASDSAGALRLTGAVGSTHSLQGVAGGANAVIAFSTTQVNGTGYVPNLRVV